LFLEKFRIGEAGSITQSLLFQPHYDNVKYFVDFPLDRIIKKANLLYSGIFKLKERRQGFGYCQRDNF